MRTATVTSMKGLNGRVAIAAVHQANGDTETYPVAPLAAFPEGQNEVKGEIVYIDLAERSKEWFVPDLPENQDLLKRYTIL